MTDDCVIDNNFYSRCMSFFLNDKISKIIVNIDFLNKKNL